MFNYDRYLSQKIDQLRQAGTYRYFLEVNKSAQHFPQFYYQDKNSVQHSAVNWCSNDYLCMSTHEDVIGKLSHVAYKSGAGSGGTRNISGTTIHHRELEKTIAGWHKKEAALIFNGAYAANVTTLQTLGRNIPELIFISDEQNHSSLIEGMRSSKNEKKIFRHNDTHHLEEIISGLPANQPKLIIFESVYSMSGDMSPVKEIVAIAKKFHALTYIDEVHGVGLYGPTGAGILDQECLQEEIDIVNGTLSKAIGVYGGYIAASNTIIDFIRSFGSGFIFTTSLPPAICSAANKSISLIQNNIDWRKQFHDNVLLLRKALSEYDVNFRPNDSHITIVPVNGADYCREIATRLLEKQGIYLQPINYPTVPIGKECLRIIITAKHQPRHIQHLAYSLNKILNGDTQANREKFPAVVAAIGDSETED